MADLHRIRSRARRWVVLPLLAVSSGLLAACAGEEGGQVLDPEVVPVATVTVTPDTATIIVGRTAILSATFTAANGQSLDGRTVTWTSSDTSIARLSASGSTATLEGKAAGQVTVSAASEGRVGTARISVVSAPVARVTVSPGSLFLIEGRTASLTAQVLDEGGNALDGRTVTWTSDNPAVATVSGSGVVTAIATGNANVSAMVENVVSAAVPVQISSSSSSGTWTMGTERIGEYWTLDGDWNAIVYGGPGDFNGDGRRDLVVTSWTFSATSTADWTGSVRNPPAPVKIYLQSADGQFEDATQRLLGGEVMAYAMQPLVGDVNRDGVDDVILPGFADLPAMKAPGLALISSGATFTQLTLPTAWVHGADLTDADSDGCLDVVGPTPENGFLQGDCVGGFQRREWDPTGPGWVIGNDACVADFNGDGRNEIALTDAYTSEPPPVNDLVVYEIDWSAEHLKPTALHRLPVPVLDRGNTTPTGISHDQRCAVGDLNGDSRPDIVVSSTPNAVDRVSWEETSKLQVYLNRGGFNFEDVSDQAFPGRSDNSASSFSMFLRDINADGLLDLVYPANGLHGRMPSQIWFGVGDGTFRDAPGVDFEGMFAAAFASVRSRTTDLVVEQEFREIIPIERQDGRYDVAVPVITVGAQGRWTIRLEISRVGWVFR